MKVVVTGATGFVGRHLCRALVEHGDSVVALARRPDPIPDVDVHVVNGYDRLAEHRRIFTGAEAVVHLAARVHVMREVSRAPLQEYLQANVRATEYVAHAAMCAGVRRFIFLSTTKVNGEVTERPLSEQDAPHPGDPYGVSKLEAERLLCSIPELETIILRSPMVYGPGVGANFFKLLQAVEKGIPLPVLAVENRRSIIFVRNLVDAIVTVVPQRVTGTFFVSDGEPLSTPDLVRSIADAMGRRANLWGVQPSLLVLVGRLFGKRDMVDRLVRSLEVDDTAFRRTFGWVPPFSTREGIAQTVDWFRSRRVTSR